MKAKVRTFSGTTSNEVTQREIDNRALARKAAAEGFVLLKNEEHFLFIVFIARDYVCSICNEFG